MSELISRDYLLDTISSMIAYHNSASDVYDMVEDAPTVDAIPVEWLKQFRNSLDNLSECKLMEAIDTIVDAYKAERKEE